MKLATFTVRHVTALTLALATSCTAWGQGVISDSAPYRAVLPSTESPWLNQVLADAGTVFYDDHSMPPAYQNWDTPWTGFHSPAHNLAGSADPHGNANMEFPWRMPFGVQPGSGVKTFRFLHLPQSANGVRWPVVWWRDGVKYGWTFPAGAVVGEVLYLKTKAGEARVFEVRTRFRMVDRWKVNVFRPYPEAADLLVAARKLPPTTTSSALVGSLTSEPVATWASFADVQPGKRVIAVTGQREFLPPVTEAEAVALLSATFKSVVGKTWRLGKWSTHAPSSKQSFHIVPQSYAAGFVSVDEVSCMRCHETAGKLARTFDNTRKWHGGVRGSDAILSFHPVARASISFDGANRAVAMEPALVARGIIAKYDPKVHSDWVYRTIPGLS